VTRCRDSVAHPERLFEAHVIEGKRTPFARIQQYLHDGFVPHPVDISVNPWILGFTKWYFDFIKNTIPVAALFAIAKKTNSIAIGALAWLSFGILGMYIVHNTQSWHFVPFHGFKNSRLASIANGIVWSIFAGVLTGGVQYALITAINTIVDINAK
jgi:hypothetical protein